MKPTAVDLLEAVDQATMRHRIRTMSLSTSMLLGMCQEEEIDINPRARSSVWTSGQQSRFIESLILELPIPQIFLVETNPPRGGLFELIDGMERLWACALFTGDPIAHLSPENSLRLTDCEVLPILNGLTFSNLPTAIQIRIRRASWSVGIASQESVLGRY